MVLIGLSLARMDAQLKPVKDRENPPSNGLNPRQREAATAPMGQLLIVAGAGTGKTKTLTERIVHILASGANPTGICALTFTNKAAQEMLERVKSRLGNVKTAPYVGTFHALGAWILRHEAPRLGRTAQFVIFDNGDSFGLIRKILKARSGKTKLEKDAPAFFADHISLIKNGSGELDEIDRSYPHRRFADFFLTYETALRDQNAFDFDDLIYHVVQLFARDPRVREKYERRFVHVLVDEYQDINTMQYELVRHLSHASESLSVVGDAAQTIYTWRGSRVQIFLDFSNTWPQAKTVFLNENYRSTKTIIRAATAVIKESKEVLRDRDGLTTLNEVGDPITLYEARSEYDEAEWIARHIAATGTQKINGRAILYRTNAQSRAIEQALLDFDIPYVIFGGLKFYERREIKDIVAGIRFAANPNDVMSRERLEKAFTKRAFAALEGTLANLHEEKPTEIIRHFLRATDYFDYLARETTNADERRENIAELIRFATAFDDVPSFLERIALNGPSDAPSKGAVNPGTVVLMTIHLAKGLEFDEVFLAGVSEGLLPHGRSLSSKSELEEERRLMYVAMTRARKKLFLSFSDIPSRFLGDIPEDCLHFENGNRSSPQKDFLLDPEERYISIE